MNALLVASVAILPCILIFIYIYTHDEHPEPKGLITKVAFAGAFAAIPVIIFVELIKPIGLPQNSLLAAGFMAFIWAAIPEEFFKLIMVYTVAYKRPEFDEPFDGVIYGAASSLGFAMLENLLYVGQSNHLLTTGVLRAFTAIPMHLFCGVTMGYFIGRAKFTTKGKTNIHFWLLAYLIPMLIHGIYDGAIFYTVIVGDYIYYLPGILTLLFVIVFGIVLMKRLEKNNLSILSGYYGISLSKLNEYLPPGEHSESKLPIILKYFREAAVTGGSWAIPHDFHKTVSEKLKTEDITPTRRSRGVLGFIFSISGIFWAGFGSLLIVAMFTPDKNNLSPNNHNHLVAILGVLGVFMIINGIMLFVKGIRRNRVVRKSRYWIVQFLIVIANIALVSVLGNALNAYNPKAKNVVENPNTLLYAAGAIILVWLILVLFPKKKT